MLWLMARKGLAAWLHNRWRNRASCESPHRGLLAHKLLQETHGPPAKAGHPSSKWKEHEAFYLVGANRGPMPAAASPFPSRSSWRRVQEKFHAETSEAFAWRGPAVCGAVASVENCAHKLLHREKLGQGWNRSAAQHAAPWRRCAVSPEQHGSRGCFAPSLVHSASL